ncbi:MAG: 50S ribosomal protein L18 [Rickettsiales bacterium]|nr:50S ribosomal protein L18 [Rickettsiales bacterium]|tara:strand:- start:858 stop:1217 length:360 start_codon:yes stop_codon:yes gene_type:complete
MKRVSADVRRKMRARFKIKQKANGRPRLSVHRSGQHMYAQLIDDLQGVTLVAASTLDQDIRKENKNGATMKAAEAVGKLIGERAKKANIDEVVFDRGSFLYHGRVKALADAARQAGLKF